MGIKVQSVRPASSAVIALLIFDGEVSESKMAELDPKAYCRYKLLLLLYRYFGLSSPILAGTTCPSECFDLVA